MCGQAGHVPRPGTGAVARMCGLTMARGSSWAAVERTAAVDVVVESKAKFPSLASTLSCLLVHLRETDRL